MLDDKDVFGEDPGEVAAGCVRAWAIHIVCRPKPTHWHKKKGFSNDCLWLKFQVMNWEAVLDQHFISLGLLPRA